MAAEFKVLQLREYHRQFVSKQTRSDGRGFNDFREVLLSSNSIETSDGSSLVKMGNTTFVCGIKAILADPLPEEPGKGFLEVTVDLPPLCSSRFRTDRITGDNDESQVITDKINKVMADVGCLDLKDLCIAEGKMVWSLLFEAICLDYDGNLFDACLLSVLAALESGSLPVVELKQETDKEAIFGEERRPLKVKNYPVSTSFAIFDEKHLLLDPTHEEEGLSEGLLTIVVNASNGQLALVNKQGGHGLNEKQIEKCLKKSEERSQQIKEMIIKKASSC